MDDKMKAAFRAWHDSVTYIGPEDIVEWTLDYLRSQQEPAAGEEVMVNTPCDVFTLPLQPSGLSSGPRFVVHVPQTEARGSDDVQLDAAKSTAAIAWGWLWHVTTADDRVKTARHLLGQMLDKDLKRYGIQNAKDGGAQVNVQEIEAAMLRGESILPQQKGQPERRSYNASGSLSEYGVFPECDAPRPAEAYAGCTIWRGNLRVSVTETKVIERRINADEAFCDLVQRALDSLAAAWDATAKQRASGGDHD